MKPVLAAALLLAPLAFAQPASAAFQMAQMPGGAGSGQMRKLPGVSDQGNAILNEAMNAPDQQLQTVIGQQRGVRDQLNAAANAPSIDVDRVAALMKQREDLQAQYRQLLDARLLNALRQLPAADRGPFMRALANPPAGGRQ